jgi:hypothetical protein
VLRLRICPGPLFSLNLERERRGRRAVCSHQVKRTSRAVPAAVATDGITHRRGGSACADQIFKGWKVAISDVDSVCTYTQLVTVPDKTKAQRERELLDARISRERELEWPYYGRGTGFHHIPKVGGSSLSDAGAEGKFTKASISSMRDGFNGSFNSMRGLTESSVAREAVAREAEAPKSHIASMGRQGREWSTIVNNASVTIATLITAAPGGLSAKPSLFAAAVTLAVLSFAILLVAVIMGFISICRSRYKGHRFRIIRRTVRQRGINTACRTHEAGMVQAEENAKTLQENDCPHEHTSASTSVYLD